MAYHQINILAPLLGVSLILFALSSFVTSVRHARKARAMGCQPAFRRKSKFPFGLDFIWGMIQAGRDQILPAHLDEVYKKMGRTTWRQSILGTEVYVTSDAKNIQAVLATQFNDFEMGPIRRGSFFPAFGNGIFTTDGQAWEHSRGMLRPQFARQQVADLELEEIHLQNMLKHLTTKDGWTSVVDLSPLFFRLTLDSATEFLFGQSVLSQLAALPSQSSVKTKDSGRLNLISFASAFDNTTMAISHRARLSELYWLYSPKHFHDDIKVIHQFADYYVNLALTTDLSISSEGQVKGQGRDRYVFLKELVKATRDPIELRSQLLNILLAGRDTTAGLLGWVFYHLVRRPGVFNKLRATVIEQFGTYENPKDMTFETLKACSYLQYTMNEALRINSTVPFNSRRAVRDTTLPRGGGVDGNAPVFVKRGQEVNYSVHALHQREDIWGPDFAEFKPERWAGRRPGWEFLPFNGGPRICLGQQFALTEAGYVTVRLLQRFDKMESYETDPVMRHQYSVTTSPARVPLRLHEAAAG